MFGSSGFGTIAFGELVADLSAITGTLATTNANDTCSASGSAGSSTITGTLATTNSNDTASANGTTTIIGSLATTNANDLLSSYGWAGTITGTVAVVNGNDTVVAIGSGGNVVTSVPSGGYDGDFRGHPYLRPSYEYSSKRKKKKKKDDNESTDAIQANKENSIIDLTKLNRLTGIENKMSRELTNKALRDDRERMERYRKILSMS